MSEAISEAELSTEIVIDEDLLRIAAFISENLPRDRARLWPEQVSTAIQARGDASGSLTG